MAEFCLDCWNKINGTNEPESDYYMSKHPDLCEGCGKYKKVIIRPRSYGSRGCGCLFIPLMIIRRIFLDFYNIKKDAFKMKASFFRVCGRIVSSRKLQTINKHCALKYTCRGGYYPPVFTFA